MQLLENWKDVLIKAWSIRFIILAGILSGLEVILPLFSSSMPTGLFSALSFMAVSCSFIARIVVQSNLK